MKPNLEDFQECYGKHYVSENGEAYEHVLHERINDNVQVVLYHAASDTYWEANAYYSSWDGENWDEAEVHQVTPQEKTVTEYVIVR